MLNSYRPLKSDNFNYLIENSFKQISDGRPPLVPVLGTSVKSANNPVFPVEITKGNKGLGLGLIDGLVSYV